VQDKLTADDFSLHQDTSFTLSADEVDPVETTLIDITRMGAAPDQDSDRRQAFSIVLRGPADAHLPQQIYQVKHEQMGTLILFLVPIGQEKDGTLFEAVFT